MAIDIDDNFSKLATKVNEAGGLISCRMERLRDLYRAGRLGTHIRNGIVDKLEQNGLGFFPDDELPSNQDDEIRIYAKGKPIAKIINAVLDPSRTGDKHLLDVTETKASEVLKRVRELVCED